MAYYNRIKEGLPFVSPLSLPSHHQANADSTPSTQRLSPSKPVNPLTWIPEFHPTLDKYGPTVLPRPAQPS